MINKKEVNKTLKKFFFYIEINVNIFIYFIDKSSIIYISQSIIIVK